MEFNITNKIAVLSFAVVALLAISCESDDAYEFALAEKPVVTATATERQYTIEEGDTLFLEFTVDQPINRAMQFQMLVNGSAEMDSDYWVGDEHLPGDNGDPTSGYRITVPAYTETFEVPFIAYSDLVPQEGSETVNLTLSAVGVRTALTEDENGIEFDITIQEVESENYFISLDWTGSYLDEEEEEHDWCDFDLDLEIYDAAGEIVGASYSSCPEELTITPGDLPDGTYTIVATYWSPLEAALPVDFDAIPATVILAQPGVTYQEVDLTQVWTDFTAGADEDNPNAFVGVATLEISGSNYTLNDVYTPGTAEEEGDGTEDGGGTEEGDETEDGGGTEE